MSSATNKAVAQFADRAGAVAGEIAQKTAEFAGTAVVAAVDTVIEQAPPKAVVLGLGRTLLAKLTLRQIVVGGVAGLAVFALVRRIKQRSAAQSDATQDEVTDAPTEDAELSSHPTVKAS